MASSGKIDVMIPTLNEAKRIVGAVRNASQIGQVWVLDSGSTDGTRELAASAGAEVVVHAFVNYSDQKNWGLDNIPFIGEWVLILDADERITPALRDEVLRTVASNPNENGFFINRMLLFMASKVRHGGMYPSWNLRLFRRGKAYYERRSVHEHMLCDGPTGYLKNDLLHVRTESMAEFIQKHIRYADMESDEWLKQRLKVGGGASEHRLFSRGLAVRQWLRRHVWPNLPGRPIIRMLYMYVIRLGFLDGRAGWHLAKLMASYEYMIELLYKEKRARQRGDIV